MAINVIQPKHMESQESVEQSQNTNKLQNQNIENHKLTEQSKTEINQQEKNKQVKLNLFTIIKVRNIEIALK